MWPPSPATVPPPERRHRRPRHVQVHNQPEDYRTRPADLDHAPVIAAVHVASWLAAYRGLLDEEFLTGLSVGDRTRQWEQLLADRSSDQVWVVEVDGGVVGFAHAGPCRDAGLDPDTAELYTFYLHPGAWGLGAGRFLHDAVLARLAEAGFASVVLWVLDTNQRARRFYERQGWSQTVGVRTQRFGTSVVTDYRYGRPLP